jgi:hypothetical protein
MWKEERYVQCTVFLHAMQSENLVLVIRHYCTERSLRVILRMHHFEVGIVV